MKNWIEHHATFGSSTPLIPGHKTNPFTAGTHPFCRSMFNNTQWWKLGAPLFPPGSHCMFTQHPLPFPRWKNNILLLQKHQTACVVWHCSNQYSVEDWIFGEIQLVVHHQRSILIGCAISRLFLISYQWWTVHLWAYGLAFWWWTHENKKNFCTFNQTHNPLLKYYNFLESDWSITPHHPPPPPTPRLEH